MAAANRSTEHCVDLDRKRRSDEEFLRTIGRDLAALYSDVLHAPIPERIAAISSRLGAMSPEPCSLLASKEATGRASISARADRVLQR
jgi:hypothetical protein